MSERFDTGVECCEENIIHNDLVKLVREKLPAENDMQDLAELFKIFGDTTRIRILFVLFEAEVWRHGTSQRSWPSTARFAATR